MSIIYSRNTTFDRISVNSVSSNGNPARRLYVFEALLNFLRTGLLNFVDWRIAELFTNYFQEIRMAQTPYFPRSSLSVSCFSFFRLVSGGSSLYFLLRQQFCFY